MDVERHDLPFAWEFADPEIYARALSSTGPAFEAEVQVGAAAFRDECVRLATEQLREGLPLRAVINLVGYVARRPEEGH